jgi:hypothetical protein
MDINHVETTLLEIVVVDIDPIAVEMLIAVTDPSLIETIGLHPLGIVVPKIDRVPNSGEIGRLAIATIAAVGKIDPIQKSPKKKSPTISMASIPSSPRSKTNAKSIGFGSSPNSATIQPSSPSLPKPKQMGLLSMK